MLTAPRSPRSTAPTVPAGMSGDPFERRDLGQEHVLDAVPSGT